LQWLATTRSDVVAVFDDVGSVAVYEVMVGDRCGEKFSLNLNWTKPLRGLW
jgi:hypothetical protein